MLSKQQNDALSQIRKWRESASSQLFYLEGPAGTGKTTIVEALEDGVIYGAFTAKAVSVLSSKGCAPASTLHKLLYLPKEKSRQKLRELQKSFELTLDGSHEREVLRRQIEEEKKRVKSPNFSLNPDSPLKEAKLLVVDETSMMDTRLTEDCLSFGIPVLGVGDSFQLPPVKGTGYFTKRKADFYLTEIHRQAEGSPVLQMATDIRLNDRILKNDYGEGTRRVAKKALSPEEVARGYDQVICGRNDTRRYINSKIRETLGYTEKYPEVGEKLICLRNNYDTGVLNGSQWVVEASDFSDNFVSLSLTSLDGKEKVLTEAHFEPFAGEDIPFYSRMDADEFDFAYAVTCHKAQGSQWESVLVVDESGVFKSNASKWLYTAVTRASKTACVIQ